MLDHNLMPIDGSSIEEALHGRGINVRYLGKILSCVSDIAQLDYLRTVLAMELVCRSAKHLCRVYLQSVCQPSLSVAIAHFLNCLLSSVAPPTPQLSALDEPTLAHPVQRSNGKAKKIKRQNTHNSSESPPSPTAQDISIDWTQTTMQSLWDQIVNECDSYYGFKIDSLVFDATRAILLPLTNSLVG